jgi:hypothetical protein
MPHRPIRNRQDFDKPTITAARSVIDNSPAGRDFHSTRKADIMSVDARITATLMLAIVFLVALVGIGAAAAHPAPVEVAAAASTGGDDNTPWG